VDTGEPQRVRFLPLAIAAMEGGARCVAGVHLGTRKWLRPVVHGYRCIFEEEAALFKPNHVHQLVLGGPQRRRHEDDPLGYHAEDRVLREIGSAAEPVSPAVKLQVLEDACDRDLKRAIEAGKRSLFLVNPETYAFRENQQDGARFLFSSELPATRYTGGRRFTLKGQRIAIGSAGPKCTCPQWVEFARARWPGWSVHEDLLHSSFPGARLYLVVSLSALYEDYYWLIVAGVHVVHEVRIWL